MTISITYLVGTKEPFDETLRHYFSTNWVPSETNGITPVFLSPHGKDSDPADLNVELSQADIENLKASGLILFQTTEHIPLSNASNDQTTIETPILITAYARTKNEMSLFISHINDIMHENMPNSSVRIKKSNGTEDSAIAYFKQRKGIQFSQPQVKDKEGFVYISTGFLSCMWVKTKTA